MSYTLSGNSHGDILFEGDTYLVVATPEEGCEKSVKGVVDCQGTSCNLNVESLLSYPSCFGAQDGSIEVVVENGLGPFSYSWSHTEEDVSQFSSIGGGEYYVTITDALGCVSSVNIKIEQPDPLSSSVDWSDQTMTGMSDGMAAVDIVGGTLPYTIEWSTGEVNPSIIDLAPGEYSVTITDYNGCTSSHDIIVNEVDCVFSVDAELIHVTCFGGNDASISLSTTEDIESVEWDNDVAGTILNGIGEGIFTANITLSNGCEKIESYTITQPEAITFGSDISNVKCFGEANGVIIPMVDGGNGDFFYSWEDGSTDLVHSGLSEGAYTLNATDHLGCTEKEIFIITQPELLEVASSMVTDLSCADSQDGQICVFVEGGIQPYRFEWEDLDDGMSKMTDLAAGIYNLLVTDLNQCTLMVEQIVDSPLPLEINVEIMSINEGDDGHIKINVEGGVSPYKITWYLNNDAVGTGIEISDLAEGIYRAVIVDANGCILESPDYLLSPTSITELTSSEFTIYPNPVKSTFIIESNDNISIEYIKVYSVTGQDVTNFVSFFREGQLLKGSNNELFSGLYYIEVSGHEGIVGDKIPLIISEF